jgi:glycerate 2-kinase
MDSANMAKMAMPRGTGFQPVREGPENSTPPETALRSFMVAHLEPLQTEPHLPAQGKRMAEQIFLKTLARLDVRVCMLSRIKRESGQLTFDDGTCALEAQNSSAGSVPLSRPPYVIALGKAANEMSLALHEILDGEVASGVVVAPTAPAAPLECFRYVLGSHPYPNVGGVEGAGAALDLVAGLGRDDFVIFLISGGGSALFEKPLAAEVTLADLIEFNKVLVTCGLPIEQINVLRKHLSAVKGGRLALRAFPAQQLTVFISDVPEALDSMVASGPTFPDASTVDECYALAADNNLTKRFPARIRTYFEERSLEETPKPGDRRFNQSHYFRLLSNRDAVASAGEAAGKMGLVAEVDRGRWDDDFRVVAAANSAALDELAARNPGAAVCLVVGGEVTCPVTGHGTGGRNQAFVLHAAGLVAGRNRVVLSAGTDGLDGNSPAAGAVADGQTLARAQTHGIDSARYLAESDSYHFFRTLGDTIEVGYTGNNVRDLRLWLDFGK